MAKSKLSINTTSDLRTVLLKTIQGVVDGEVDHKQGASVASLSKAVIASARLDFDVLRFHEETKVSGSALKAIELQKS